MVFVRGQSGNPSGRPKKSNRAETLAREHVTKAVQVLVDNLASKDEDVRARAAQALLDRGFGKAREFVEIDADVVSNITGEVGLSGTDRALADVAARRKKAASKESGEA